MQDKFAKVAASLKGERAMAAGMMASAKLAQMSAQADIKQLVQLAETKTSSWSSRQVPAKPATQAAQGKGAKDPATSAMRAASLLSGHNQAVMNKGRWVGKLGTWVPVIRTEADVIESNRQKIGTRIAKSEGVGQLSNQEREVYADGLMGFGITKAGAGQAIDKSYAPILAQLKAQLTATAPGPARARLQKTLTYVRTLKATDLAKLMRD
jgi:hypothetical protein